MVNSKSNKLDSSRVGLSKLQPVSSVLTGSLVLEVKFTGTRTHSSIRAGSWPFFSYNSYN